MMVLFGQSSGPVEPFDPQILSQKGSLFLTRPELGHYTATRAELLERAGRGAGLGGRRRSDGADRARVSAGAGGRRAPGARGAAHDRQGAAHPVTLPARAARAGLDRVARRAARPRRAPRAGCVVVSARPRPRRPPPSTPPATFPARSSSISTPSATTRPRCRTCCPAPRHSPDAMTDARPRRRRRSRRVRRLRHRTSAPPRAWWMFRVFGHGAGGGARRRARPSGGGRAGRSRPAAVRLARRAGSPPGSTAPRSGTSTRCARTRAPARSRWWTCARRAGSPAPSPSRAPAFGAATSPAAGTCRITTLVAADGTLLPAGRAPPAARGGGHRPHAAHRRHLRLGHQRLHPHPRAPPARPRPGGAVRRLVDRVGRTRRHPRRDRPA